MSSRMAAAFAAALSVVVVPCLYAHPPLDERIGEVSYALIWQPRDVRLLVTRGELLGLAGQRTSAEEDFAEALSIDPHSADAYLGRAELRLATGSYADAQRDVAASLRLRPESVRAWRTQGRILAKRGAIDGASASLDRALSLDEAPRPDDYVERAELSRRRGRLDEAIAVLDRGYTRLSAPALAWRALELVESRGDARGALDRLDTLARVTPPSPTMTAKRGDLLAAACRRMEATAEWTQALEMLEGASRGAPADTVLAARLRGELKKERH